MIIPWHIYRVEDKSSSVIKQAILGDFSDEKSLKGTLARISLSFILVVDTLTDIRDVIYSTKELLINPSRTNVRSWGFDIIGFIPYIGNIKYLKHADDIIDAAGDIGKHVDDITDVSEIKNVYNSIKDAPKYPLGFTPLTNKETAFFRFADRLGIVTTGVTKPYPRVPRRRVLCTLEDTVW